MQYKNTLLIMENTSLEISYLTMNLKNYWKRIGVYHLLMKLCLKWSYLPRIFFSQLVKDSIFLNLN